MYLAFAPARWKNGGMVVALERELETFRRVLPAMLADPAKQGQFALIHGDDVAGLFPSFAAALTAGYDQFGLGTFLVKEVTDHEEPKYFSRNIAPCQ